MSSMALNQVAKCLQSSCISQLRTYIQFFFFRITSVDLQSKNIFLSPSMGWLLWTPRCALEHEHSLCHSKSPAASQRAWLLFHTRAKASGSANTWRWTLSHTVMCRIQRKCIFPLGTQYPWLPPFFTKHAVCEISKGNLDVKPCVCSQAQECTEGKAPCKALQIFLISVPPGADQTQKRGVSWRGGGCG